MSITRQKLQKVDSLIVTSPLCAQFFNISQQYLRKWKKNGCPNLGHGMWNLYDVFGWWQEHIMATAAEESDKDLSEIKKDYWEAKTRVERVKAETLEEKYLPKEELGEEWSWRAGVFRSGLLAFSSRVPPLLEGKKQLQMRDILHDEACLVLAALSKDHKFCPADALPKDYANLRKRETKQCRPKKKKSSTKKK